MYLLWYNEKIDLFSLVQFGDIGVPRYAILSHTWGLDEDELNFQDVSKAAGIYRRYFDEKDQKAKHKLVPACEPTVMDLKAPDSKKAMDSLKQKAGYSKIQFCGTQAEKIA